MNDQVIIIIVRDPDASNDVTIFGTPAPLIIDVDLGYMDLGDPDEFIDWAYGHLATAAGLPEGPARDMLIRLVDNTRENHSEITRRWLTLEALEADMENR